MTACISTFEADGMKKYAKVVDVPKIDEEEKAYNHDRPISSLLLHQLRHLHAAEQSLPEKDRTDTNVSRLHTEREASKYIQQVMRKLHPQGFKGRSEKARTRRRRHEPIKK